MSRVSISQNKPVHHSIICRYCREPLQQITSSGGGPGSSESTYVTPDRESWCDFAGNRLTRQEWLQQPQHKLTVAELLKDKGNFSPYQYHEPVFNQSESELVA